MRSRSSVRAVSMITGTALLSAQLLQHFESIEHRQHPVQNHQIELSFERPRQAPAAIVRGFERELMLRKKIGHQSAKLRVILDQKD